jgi:hypothetical protein
VLVLAVVVLKPGLLWLWYGASGFWRISLLFSITPSTFEVDKTGASAGLQGFH